MPKQQKLHTNDINQCTTSANQSSWPDFTTVGNFYRKEADISCEMFLVARCKERQLYSQTRGKLVRMAIVT